MTKDEFKKAYINHTLGDGTMHCDDKTVPEGLSTLDNLITSANSIAEENQTYISDIKALPKFYGFVQNNCLSEDNLFYDLNIPSYGGDNTENIIEDFLKYTDDLKNDLAQLKKDIESTKDAIEKYNNEELSAGDKGVIASAVSLFDDYEEMERKKLEEASANGLTDLETTSTGGNTTANPINSSIGGTGSSSSSQGNVAYRKVTATPTKTVDIDAEPLKNNNTSTEQERQKKLQEEDERRKQQESEERARQQEAEEKRKVQEEQEKEIKRVEEEKRKQQEAEEAKKQQIEEENNKQEEILKNNNKNNNQEETRGTYNPSYEPQVMNNSGSTNTPILTEIEKEGVKMADVSTNIEKETAEVKMDSTKLSSSVKNTESSLKPTTKVIPEEVIEEDSNSSKFIPPIAGVATASIAGIGTKLYIDKKKEEDDSDEDDDENRKFFEEDDIEREAISKEDLVEMLDDK